MSTPASLPLIQAVAAGVVLGLAYTLSPLTVLLLAALTVFTWKTAKILAPRERRWFVGVVTIAIALRLMAIAGLFLSADPALPYATFFGDEELFKSRSIWLRNIGLGVPISGADFIYAVEETGKSQYLFFLAYLEALVGEAPYGVHVLNTTMYVAGVLTLYRLVRPGYGPLAAMGGLVVMLFLPSLFIWSVSALKEPLYALVAVVELVCVMHIVRSRTWARRLLAVAGVVVTALVLEGLRKGGILVTAIGTSAGLLGGFTVRRPRLAVAALAAAPLLVVGLLQMPAVHDRVMSVVRDSAVYHVGHIYTVGYSYKTLDPWYYIDPPSIRTMPASDAGAFVARSLVGYFTQPLPWTIESTCDARVPARTGDLAGHGGVRAARGVRGPASRRAPHLRHRGARVRRDRDGRSDQRQCRHADPAPWPGAAVPGLAVGAGRLPAVRLASSPW